MFIIAPATNFSGGRIISLAGSILSPDPTVSVHNGVSYQAIRIYSTFGPIQATGGAITASDIPGTGDQFLVIPDADFDASDNPSTLANAFIANDTTLTLSNIAYRICALTQASDPFMARGAAYPFTPANWQLLPKTTTAGDQLDFVVTSLPNDGGYPATDIEIQTGVDNGLGGITWGAIRNIGLVSTSITVLALTKTYVRARLVTGQDNPWGDVQSATPVKTASDVSINFDLAQVYVSGATSTVTHADGIVAIVSSGPVTITGKSPAMSGAGATLRNGHKKNPVRYPNIQTGVAAAMQGYQAFDGRASNGNSADTPDAFPVTLNPGDVFVTAVSKPESVTNGRQGPVDEYYAIYVTASAPDPATLGPAVIGWAGRSVLSVPAAIDYTAKAGQLPSTYDVPAVVYHTLAEVRKGLRLNPGSAITTKTAVTSGSNPNGGYEYKLPYMWGGRLINPAYNTNYGRYCGQRISDIFLHLFAPLDRVSLEVKAEILMRLDSYAWQTLQALEGTGQSIGGDGGHNQWQFAIFALHHWLRGNSSALDTLIADHPTNWGVQNFYLTQSMVDTWFQPWGDPDNLNGIFVTDGAPNCYYRRRIQAVDATAMTVRIPPSQGGTGASQGDSDKARYSSMYLVRESDGVQAFITSQPSGDIGTGANDITLQLSSWPGFAVGDVIYIKSAYAVAPGMPQWRLKSGSLANIYEPSGDMSYQDLQRHLGALCAMRILAQLRPGWDAVWDYAVSAMTANYPASNVDFPAISDPDSIAASFWSLYSTALQAIPQPYLGEAPLSPFYPPVPDVSLSTGASIKLPEGNYSFGNNALLTFKGALSQPEAGITRPASSTGQAMFAIVRLPQDKRWFEGSMGVWGNGTANANIFGLRYCGRQPGVSADLDKFQYYHRGNGSSGMSNLKSPAWTEDAALVVASTDGTSNWLCDWYSLIDGTRYTTGVPNVSTQNAISNPDGTAIGIGLVGGTTAYGANSNATTQPSPLTVPHWGGEIEAVGLVNRAVAPSEWQAIALGADILTTLGPASVKYLREFTNLNYSANPAATLDTTGPAAPVAGGVGIPAATVIGGSKLRRTGVSAYLTVNQVTPGQVYGLKKGADTAFVPFSGKAVGYAGNVECRVYDATSGDVVRDWTVVGAIASGAWSGTVELPKATGWWFADFRPAASPTVIVQRRSEFAVGWKIVCIGQSQMNIGFKSGAALSLITPMSVSLVENDNGVAAGNQPMTCVRVGMLNLSSSVNAFVNQWRKKDPLTPMMIIRDSVQGTSMYQFIDNAKSADRSYALSFGPKIAAYGNDVSLVIHEWGTNDMSVATDTEFKGLLSALFFGTGAYAKDNSLAGSLQAGWTPAFCPLTRHTGGSSYYNNANQARGWGVDWANSNGVTVGPPLSDIRIGDGGGPHQASSGPRGSNLFMSRLAIAGLRAMGLDSSQNPYFTTAAFNPSRTQITVNVALPNGGSLYCDIPAAVRSFSVNGLSTGFTAAVVGNTIVLTSTGGAWAVGSTVSYASNLENRADGDGVAEDAIVNSALYETWPDDILGKGLPVLGSMSGGKWIPGWSVTVT